MKNIDITNKESVEIEVKKGENYWCCTCGKSKAQPFCDGSHKGGGCKPFKYEATKDTTERFCTGKETCNKSCSMLNTASLD